MRSLVTLSAVCLFGAATCFATEVQTAPPKPTPSPAAASPGPASDLPKYRPAVLGTGPLSLINRIDTAELMRSGQKDASLMFCCSVATTGEIVNTWIYRATPGSTALERQVFNCLDTSVFVPAVYNQELVHVLFYGTVSFKVVDGKPRLRIFANQEAAEVSKESDFIGPQPFVGGDSKFTGLHYPVNVLGLKVSGLVELAVKIDADGNLKDIKMVSEYPPLAGFGERAMDDFRGAKFVPAFREGKPVECNITLPVYYELEETPAPPAVSGLQP
jgi:TonB family protein